MTTSNLLLSLVTLLLITFSGLTPTFTVSADEVKRSRADIPTEDNAGNWLLASGSDIQHLTTSAGDTLYAYVEGLDYTLYQSTDVSHSWSYIGDVQDSIVDIAISPLDEKPFITPLRATFIAPPTAGRSLTILGQTPVERGVVI